MTDPEVSTVQNTHDETALFCGGNFNVAGISNFFEIHHCSKYCAMLDLEPYAVNQSEAF